MKREMLARVLNTRERQLADRIYNYSLKVFTEDGTVPVGFQKQAIEEAKRTTKVTKDVQPEAIFDFQAVQRARRSLRERMAALNWLKWETRR